MCIIIISVCWLPTKFIGGIRRCIWYTKYHIKYNNVFLECHCPVHYVDVGDSPLLQFMGTASLAAGKTSHLVSMCVRVCINFVYVYACMSISTCNVRSRCVMILSVCGDSIVPHKV